MLNVQPRFPHTQLWAFLSPTKGCGLGGLPGSPACVLMTWFQQSLSLAWSFHGALDWLMGAVLYLGKASHYVAVCGEEACFL